MMNLILTQQEFNIIWELSNTLMRLKLISKSGSSHRYGYGQLTELMVKLDAFDDEHS